MLVKELIAELNKLPQNDKIVVTAMNDDFCLSNFEVHSPYEDGQAQEIILNCYIDHYTTGNE